MYIQLKHIEIIKKSLFIIHFLHVTGIFTQSSLLFFIK